MSKSLLSVVAAGLLALTAADTASAAWSVSAAGSGQAAADTAAAPTGLATTWDPVVHLSWTPSSSSWATGYRVLRSVTPGGPYSLVADVAGAATTTTDDTTAGAGSFYYTLRTYRQSWTSPASNEASRQDPTYVFKATTAFTADACPSSTGKADMQQGYTPSGPEQTGRMYNFGFKTFAFCSDVFTTGQSLPAGTTTVNAYIENGNVFACPMSVTVALNGTTTLGSANVSVPGGSAKQLRSWSITTTAVGLASGDRVTIRFASQTSACLHTYLYWNGTGSPSSVRLTS